MYTYLKLSVFFARRTLLVHVIHGKIPLLRVKSLRFTANMRLLSACWEPDFINSPEPGSGFSKNVPKRSGLLSQGRGGDPAVAGDGYLQGLLPPASEISSRFGSAPGAMRSGNAIRPIPEQQCPPHPEKCQLSRER